MSLDIDAQHYQEQEAADLRRTGWKVEPPEGVRWEFSLCMGPYSWGGGCMVRTPRRRCRWCNKTRRLRYRAAA